MAAINTTSYQFGRGNLDAAAFPQTLTLEGGEVRTLQVLVPGATLRPYDPETGDAIPISEIRGSGNEVIADFPVTDAIGEWNFYVIGWPVIRLGVTGPETGAVEKTFLNVVSGQAVSETILAQLTGGSGTFTGSVDWQTQVTDKPAIPTSAADVGAIPVTDRGSSEGVAPLALSKVPIGHLPTGTTSTTVSRGDHTHAGSYDILPAGSLVVVKESAAGSYPARPTSRTDIPIEWTGQIQPTVAQGWRDGDRWLNVVVVT